MLNKIKSSKAIRNIGVVLLVAALLISAYFIFPVGAKRSFDYIEELKNEIGENGSFNIIEIVPQASCGAMGYYAAGSEPVSYWTGELSDKNKSERASYVSTLAGKLSAKGLLGASGTPLTTSTYTEIYPWDYNEANTAHSGAIRVNLIRKESVNIKGNFDKLPDSNTEAVDIAPYCFTAKKYRYDYNPSSAAALYAQDVLYYQKVTAGSAGNVYYNLKFTTLPDGIEENDLDGVYIYENVDDGNTDNDSETQPMQVLGCVKVENNVAKMYDTNGNRIGLDIAKKDKYYVIEEVRGTSTTYSDDYSYVGVLNVNDDSDGYKLIGDGEIGYYEQIPIEFNYVGAGSGNYKYTANNSAAEKKVNYSVIYVKSFFTNNNWFSTYVLDQAENDPFNVHVESLTPAQLNKSSEKLYGADLIVITSGLSLDNSSTAKYSTGNDISEKVATILGTLIDTPCYTPLVVDNSIRFETEESTTRLAALLNEKLYNRNNNAHQGFLDNIYIYTADQNLASNMFKESFTTDKLPIYSAVSVEITSANAGRTNDDKISTVISPAACIRHILNFMSTQLQNTTSAIRVLEIQPYTNVSQLNADSVRQWLSYSANGRDNTYSGEISIKTMASAEFVGKIDDIIENYDIVYIGDSTGSMTTSNGKPDYNDNTMDGMYYTNIGDYYRIVLGTKNSGHRNDAVLAGLLRGDYTYHGSVVSPEDMDCGEDWDKVRTSGNDITESKCQELKDAADAGMPIIVANNLVFTANPLTLRATIEKTETATGVTFTAKINGQDPATFLSSKGLTCSFTWYVNGLPISNSNAVSYSVTYDDDCIGKKYKCKVSIGLKNQKESIIRTSALQNFGIETGEGTVSRQLVQSSYTVTITTSGDKCSVSIKRDSTDVTNSVGAEFQWYYGGKKSIFNWYHEWKSTTNSKDKPNYNESHNEKACLVTIKNQNDNKNVNFFVANKQIDLPGDGLDKGLNKSVTNTLYRYSYAASINNNSQSETIFKSAVPNELSVDNTSYWYDFLKEKMNNGNVFSATEAVNYSNDLFNYVNYSNPKITELEYDAYDENDENCGIESKDLNISFKLINPSDTSPDASRYECNLYIDINSDGYFDSDDEIIEDILITNAKTNVRVENGYLQTNGVYNVYKRLLSQFIGIVPWRLEIRLVGVSGTHTSQIGYSYIKPKENESQQLNVLQIVRASSSDSTSTNLAADTSRSIFSTSAFSAIDGVDVKVGGRDAGVDANHIELSVKTDYKLDIRLVSVTNMEAIARNETGKSNTEEAVQQFVNNFDMLIIGFGDKYYQGVTKAQALAIEKFITANGGKPILYTHDATSYFNDFVGHKSEPDWLAENGSYLNRIVRSKVGLDRYGASYVQYDMSNEQNKIKRTSDLYGFTVDGFGGISGTVYNDFKNSQGVNQNNGIYGMYNNSGKYTVTKMKNDNFAVSYKPGKLTDSEPYDVNYVHGFTNYTVQNFRRGVYSSGTEKHNYTTKATIVNRGQITEYPFHIPENITVSKTHEQYYQLNINNPEIRTWYCLTSDGKTDSSGNEVYSVTPNDCANSYYIYTMGNVTYTGAGHSNTFTENEAKLFLNTIVVAYRASTEELNIAFRRTDDEGDINYYVVRDIDSLGNYGNETIKFKVSDPNVPTIYAGSEYTAVCYYMDGDTQVQIGNAVPGTVDGASSEFVIPAETISILLNGKKEATIYISATIINEETGKISASNIANLTIRKLELLNLS